MSLLERLKHAEEVKRQNAKARMQTPSEFSTIAYKKGCKGCREKALAAKAKLEEQEDMSPS